MFPKAAAPDPTDRELQSMLLVADGRPTRNGFGSSKSTGSGFGHSASSNYAPSEAPSVMLSDISVAASAGRQSAILTRLGSARLGARLASSPRAGSFRLERSRNGLLLAEQYLDDALKDRKLRLEPLTGRQYTLHKFFHRKWYRMCIRACIVAYLVLYMVETDLNRYQGGFRLEAELFAAELLLLLIMLLDSFVEMLSYPVRLTLTLTLTLSRDSLLPATMEATGSSRVASSVTHSRPRSSGDGVVVAAAAADV